MKHGARSPKAARRPPTNPIAVGVAALVILVAVALVVLLLRRKLPTEPGSESVQSIAVPVTYSGGTFVVLNPTAAPWSDVELDLNRMGRLSAGYRYRIATLGANQAVSIEAHAFTGADGSHFDPGFMPPTTMFITMQLADGHFGTSLYRFK
jgi:hypothetical protein